MSTSKNKHLSLRNETFTKIIADRSINKMRFTSPKSFLIEKTHCQQHNKYIKGTETHNMY
jgi:hypothetical protein